MKTLGTSVTDAVANAQRLGYAEACPTFDVEGTDAAHKLTLLAANPLGVPIECKRTANPSCRFATGQLEVGATQRCGNNSSNRELGQVGNLISTSLR